MSDVFELGQLPFYWRIKNAPVQDPMDVPSQLPFAFAYENELRLVSQRRDASVLKWLERVYGEDSNLGYLQDGHALAESYGGEFVSFFRKAIQCLPQAPRSAADIGCGGVYLLQRVREMGLDVTGLDPSPVTIEAGRKAGIEVVPGFYPSPNFLGRFDVVFHYNVLEHIENPVDFLVAHHANLSSSGAIMFAVPDCTDHIRMGDISIAIHEHLNYFDRDSLTRVLEAAGFTPLLMESSKNGGVLFCCAVPSRGPKGVVLADAASGTAIADDKFRAFTSSASLSIKNMGRLLASGSPGSEIGFYVPLRVFPYLGQLKSHARFRLFDDDPGLRGKYYDGYDVAIEDFQSLVERPPELLVIASLAFGSRIASRIRDHNLTGCRVVLWDEMLNGDIT